MVLRFYIAPRQSGPGNSVDSKLIIKLLLQKLQSELSCLPVTLSGEISGPFNEEATLFYTHSRQIMILSVHCAVRSSGLQQSCSKEKRSTKIITLVRAICFPDCASAVGVVVLQGASVQPHQGGSCASKFEFEFEFAERLSDLPPPALRPGCTLSASKALMQIRFDHSQRLCMLRLACKCMLGASIRQAYTY